MNSRSSFVCSSWEWGKFPLVVVLPATLSQLLLCCSGFIDRESQEMRKIVKKYISSTTVRQHNTANYWLLFFSPPFFINNKPSPEMWKFFLSNWTRAKASGERELGKSKSFPVFHCWADEGRSLNVILKLHDFPIDSRCDMRVGGNRFTLSRSFRSESKHFPSTVSVHFFSSWNSLRLHFSLHSRLASSRVFSFLLHHLWGGCLVYSNTICYARGREEEWGEIDE